MPLFRTIVGAVAVLASLAGLNVLVLRENVFDAFVLVLLGIGIVTGLLWIVLGIATRIQGETGSTLYGLNAVVSSIIFLGICVTIYAFVKRWDVSWDLTKEGRRELSPQTIQVLQGLKDDVDVICFFVHGGEARVDVAQDKTARFLERCQQYSKHLNVEFVDPQKHPERVEQVNALRLRISVVGAIVLTSGTNTREIPLSDVTSRLEERDFTNALINVSRNSRPKVYFLTGHGERDIDNPNKIEGGSDFRDWLRKEAYEVQKHLIPVTNPYIPEDCAVLVINGLQSDLHYHEIQVLDDYMARGGRLLVLLEPSVVIQGAVEAQEQLRPWLSERFGLAVGSDIVVSVVSRGVQLMFIPDFAALGDLGAEREQVEGFRGSYNAAHPITRGLDQQMILTMVRSVGFSAKPSDDVSRTVLIRSTPDTWAETDLQSLVRTQEKGAKPRVIQDPDETQGPIPIAAAATMRTDMPVGDGSRTRDARVVVIGDASIASNEGIDWGTNSNLLLNSVAWLTESEELIAIRATGSEDPPVILSPTEEKAVTWISALGPVQAVALAGFVVLWRRRRHR